MPQCSSSGSGSKVAQDTFVSVSANLNASHSAKQERVGVSQSHEQHFFVAVVVVPFVCICRLSAIIICKEIVSSVLRRRVAPAPCLTVTVPLPIDCSTSCSMAYPCVLVLAASPTPAPYSLLSPLPCLCLALPLSMDNLQVTCVLEIETKCA